LLRAALARASVALAQPLRVAQASVALAKPLRVDRASAANKSIQMKFYKLVKILNFIFFYKNGAAE
jgi:hypothetical protein